mmetsp:Transcript_98738/g.316619  ORF Transcript_98738/g.316619 Transcript_98738/m.316619 type:complete len:154 (+) Transcript_98738:108-569(+)
MVLEGRGVSFGVHDAREGVRSREEYHQLLTSNVGDTRSRIFGTDSSHSTFNSRTRAMSYGASGHDPKSEYRPTHQSYSQLPMDHPPPQAVKGGRGFHFNASKDLAERHRRGGSLGRQVVGNCTIKDDRFVYYGPHGTGHYGMNSGTHNGAHYK